MQSTALAAMSALGELELLDAVITADTGFEWRRTYEVRDWYINWLKEHGVRTEIVAHGDIRKLGAQEQIHIPFWTSDGGPLRRQCTTDFKVIPVKRRIRELLGYEASRPPHPPPGAAEMWLGISLDEWPRAAKNPVRFLVNRWPLLERRMAREDCVRWLEAHNLPVPPKSACLCCPYRRASEWISIRDETPDEFEAAVAFDEHNRHNPLAKRAGSTADELFVYRGYRPEPLATADLEADAGREKERYGMTQIPMFLCESGFCWV